MSSRLFIAKSPSFSDLEVLKAELVGLDGNSGPLGQTLKAKCRELARADSAILVAPTPESLNAPFGPLSTPRLSLWVVGKKGYMDSAKSKQRLHLLNMKVVQRVPMSLRTIQTCYQFTVMARLAPKWNKVANWLIKGSDFLTTGKAQALSLEVGITMNEITLNLIVRKLVFSPLKTEDLNTTTTILNAFKTDPHFVIPENSIYSNRCLLLPNFSVGYVFSASHQIPRSPDFPSYDKVRLHWKKQHGIILPETQDLFYQVFFKFNSGKFFSYPGSCVYKSHPVVFPSRETDVTAASFVADIHARLPTICGESVKFLNKALVASAELRNVREPAPNHSYANTKPVAKKSVPSVQLPRVQSVKSTVNFANKTPLPQTNATCPSNPTIPRVSTSINNSVHTVPIFRPKPSISTGIQKQPETVPFNRNGSAIVPIFKAKQTNVRPTNIKPANQTKRSLTYVQNEHPSQPPSKRPCFAPAVPPRSSAAQVTSRTPTTSHHATTPSVQPRVVVSTQQVVPDLNMSLGSIGPPMELLSFTSPQPAKPPQKQGKPKGKPVPREPLRVDGVSNNIIEKIQKSKAARLRKWLQENGVKCRSKDKKDDLTRMVAVHIKQTGKTFVPPS